jgi:hypothetical protein
VKVISTQLEPSRKVKAKRGLCNSLRSGRTSLNAPSLEPLPRSLVFPNSEKDRVTKTIIPRPFRKFDVANNRRLYPAATFHFGGGQPLVPTTATGGGNVGKGAGFDANLFQLRKEIAPPFHGQRICFRLTPLRQRSQLIRKANPKRSMNMIATKGEELLTEFWAKVWNPPYDLNTIDSLCIEDFVITNAGTDIVGPAALLRRWWGDVVGQHPYLPIAPFANINPRPKTLELYGIAALALNRKTPFSVPPDFIASRAYHVRGTFIVLV